MLKGKLEWPEDDSVDFERKKLEGRIAGLAEEKRFWIEQSRALQNSLQTMHRLYADLLINASRGVSDDDLRSHISEIREHLMKPVVGVEAIAAFAASLLDNTQGAYTAVNGGISILGIDRDGTHELQILQ